MHIESEILSYRPEQLHATTQALIAEITAGIEIPVGVGRKFKARKCSPASQASKKIKLRVDKPSR